MKEIIIAAAQFRAEPGNGKYNLKMAEQLTAQAAEKHADLILFPEAALSGYSSEDPYLAAIDGDREIKSLKALSLSTGMVISIGMIRRAGACGCGTEASQSKLPAIEQYIFHEGSAFRYRKIHLGSIETGKFLPGDEIEAVRTEAGVLGVNLCWESHIPDISTILRRQGMEILLCPYASGMTGERCRDNWRIHLPARASDNGVYLVAANLIMKDGKGGGMAIFGPDGKVIAEKYTKERGLITAAASVPLPREVKTTGMKGISYFDRRIESVYDKYRP
ncbi:MAG: nitrilase-related carbon-nitrogen hydrolase [Eubacterium sp.]|jgi:omega-amidase